MKTTKQSKSKQKPKNLDGYNAVRISNFLVKDFDFEFSVLPLFRAMLLRKELEKTTRSVKWII